jgi:hypothetical protein
VFPHHLFQAQQKQAADIQMYSGSLLACTLFVVIRVPIGGKQFSLRRQIRCVLQKHR